MSRADASPSPPKRAVTLAYGGGLLAMGLMDALIFVVPLWAIKLGASATEVGLLVGARSVLPCLFAIHGGVLMDRLGTRRVMAVAVAAIIAISPLYPGLPWVPALLILQMLAGHATTIAWVGAQTVIARISGGDTGYLGRFNFASRIGTFAAPILMGLLWDFTDPWIAFLFVSVWAAGLLGLISTIPEGTQPRDPIPATEAGSAVAPVPARPFGQRLREIAPRRADYTATFALILIPAIALSMGGGFLRNTTSAVQGSIYVVYLQEIGLTGTAIGVLFAAIEGASGVGSLLAGRVSRVVKPYVLMVLTTGLAILLINMTPLLGRVFALLFAAQFLRGIVQGVNQPVLFGIQARAAGPHRQGATVALRVTINRFVSIVVPPLMGVIADSAGIEASFYVLGSVLLAMTAALALAARLAPGEAP